MRMILISMLLATLVGCEKITFIPENLDKGKYICKGNDGVAYWVMESLLDDNNGNLYVTVMCKNAVTYRYKVER